MYVLFSFWRNLDDNLLIAPYIYIYIQKEFHGYDTKLYVMLRLQG